MGMNLRDWYWVVDSRVWAGKRQQWVEREDEQFAEWSKTNVAPILPGEEALVDALRFYGVPPYHKVRKSTVISRLTDEQLEQAISLLNVRQTERWRAPDQPEVNADDPDTLMILQAIGADVAVVMAPEEE